MAGTALETRWRCLHADCDAEGTAGTAKEADKAAEDHGDATRHATLCWSEPPLPIDVKR